MMKDGVDWVEEGREEGGSSANISCDRSSKTSS